MKRLAIIFMLINVVFINTNAQSWSKVGMKNFDAEIITLKFDKNQNLYAAGFLYDSTPYNLLHRSGISHVEKFNGTTWSEVGTGANALNANREPIISITIDSLCNTYAAGVFTDSVQYGKGARYVAKWDGTTWSQLGGTNHLKANDNICTLLADNNGYLYAAGYFTNGTNSSLGKTYVAKWDGTIWNELGTGANALKSYTPFSSGQTNGYLQTMIMDKMGNIYAAGSFSNSPTSNKRYVAKWDGITWSEVGTGANALNANNIILSLAVDNMGNIYAAGRFTNVAGKYYVAKWDGIKWGEVGTGANALNANNQIFSISIDKANNLYAAGWFTNSSGKYYVAKWDGIKWVELGVGSYALNANAPIAVLINDSLNNVYAGGEFTDSSVWSGYGKRYVAKWTVCWKFDTLRQAICANANYNFHGKILTQAGYYNDTTGAYNGCDSVTTLHLSILPNPTKAITVAVCSSSGYTLHNGKIIYAAGIYTDTISSTTNGCDTIVTVTATTIYNHKTITAAICSNDIYKLPNGTTTNQAGIYTDTIASANNGCDTIFTTHLSLLPNSNVTTVYDTGCVGNSYNFYGTQLFTTGVYSHILANHAGCDSLISLHLTMSNYTLLVYHQGNVLQASAARWYQWLSCPGMQPIAGATHDTFQVQTSGSYAVEANVNGCIITSPCDSVTAATGMEEITNANGCLIIYPNPANNQLAVMVSLSNHELITKIEITDLLGRTVSAQSTLLNAQSQAIDVSNFENGIYIIHVSTDSKTITQKFVVQH